MSAYDARSAVRPLPLMSHATPPRTYEAILYKGVDGRKYERVTTFDVPNATEASLAFDGDTMLCLQRRDGKPNTGLIGMAQDLLTFGGSRRRMLTSDSL